MDDAGGLELVGEYIDDELEDIVIERAKGAVDEHPGRVLQQDPRDRQTELLVLAQLPVPAVVVIEQRREPLEPEPVEGARERAPKVSAFEG